MCAEKSPFQRISLQVFDSVVELIDNFGVFSRVYDSGSNIGIFDIIKPVVKMLQVVQVILSEPLWEGPP